MAEAIDLNETELTALSEVALGNKPDATSGPLASLIERGLAAVDDGAVAFSEELRAAFEAMATCRLNLILMTDGGNPDEQFFIGEEGSAARVTGKESGLTIQRLGLDELPGAVVAGLTTLIAADSDTPLPNADDFAEIGLALDKEGLQAKAWCGLVQSRPASDESDSRSWILVVRCKGGYVWQDPEASVLAFAQTDEELAELVADLLPRS